MVSDNSNGQTVFDVAAELQDTIKQAYTTRRPLLTHLNADTTWLLSIPYPENTIPPPGRFFFNILIDPWLQGPQSDVARWFSTQWHAIKSSVATIAELNAILAETEAVCSESQSTNTEVEKPRSYIDAVAVSHEFTDHCHQATLLEIDPSVPVFASFKAVELIKSWNHFRAVIDLPAFSKGIDWRTTSTAPLPPWLGLSRLITEGNALYYHSAILICIRDTQSGIENGAEVVIYTPHGVEAATFATIATANPRVQTLAFLHGLHDVSIYLTKQLNLGGINAIQAHREHLRPKYWAGTHDEVKKGGGFIAPFLRRKVYTVQEALTKGTNKASTSQESIPFNNLGSGQCLLLA